MSDVSSPVCCDGVRVLFHSEELLLHPQEAFGHTAAHLKVCENETTATTAEATFDKQEQATRSRPETLTKNGTGKSERNKLVESNWMSCKAAANRVNDTGTFKNLRNIKNIFDRKRSQPLTRDVDAGGTNRSQETM